MPSECDKQIELLLKILVSQDEYIGYLEQINQGLVKMLQDCGTLQHGGESIQ